MKKIIILFLLLAATSGIQAKPIIAESFIIMGEETYYCDDIRVGPSNFKITTLNGIDVKIETGSIDAYSKDGYYYEKLPVVNKNQDTSGWAFMQYIASRDGYKLYRYCSNCVHYDPATDEIAPSTSIYRYYIFKDGKYVTVTDDQNTKALLMRFGVKMIS